MTEQHFDAVVFDAYGTLLDVHAAMARHAKRLGSNWQALATEWRIKQLEYSWLRSLMGRYQDFAAVTRDSLTYTLKCLGLEYDDASFARIMDKYLHLDLYPDAMLALEAMADKKLAILSNGSPDRITRIKGPPRQGG